MERRGVGQDVAHVTMEIGSAAKDGVVGYAAVEASSASWVPSESATPASRQT
jgi:hypothetical protein